jgi:hypothetical protein
MLEAAALRVVDVKQAEGDPLDNFYVFYLAKKP